jgi:hypothetical protein
MPDPSTSWDALPNLPAETADILSGIDEDAQKKLGIDISASLRPLTETEAQDLKDEASLIIQKQIDAGIRDIELLRSKMNRELAQSRKAMEFQSQMEAQVQSEILMDKINKITEGFLSSTKSQRESTKLATKADQSMIGSNKGLEIGTWGVLEDGTTVVADSSSSSQTSSSLSWSLLGGVSIAINRQQQQQKKKPKQDDGNASASTITPSHDNRILIFADAKQDPLAKILVPALQDVLSRDDGDADDAIKNGIGIPGGVDVEVYSPTASNIPLGGNNAACVVILATSFSQPSSLTKILDRILRKTLSTDGSVGVPPTQLFCISTVGTERTDKFPYSMQNLLGGKLDTRRQIEEVILNTVRNRIQGEQIPLDYTILKLNDKISNDEMGDSPFTLRPGDVLDGPTSAGTAIEVIIQALAKQPFARNSTLSISGSIPPSSTTSVADWQEFFLPLEGPEVWRTTILTNYEGSEDAFDETDLYDQLVEYVQGWADLMVSSKGLTTPIRATSGVISRSSRQMLKQDGATLLFLPTKTGKNYMSREEELATEKERRSGGGTATSVSSNVATRKAVKEGGIDVVVEITKDKELRVRARRCNYADDAVIKELSEQTILKRLQDAVDVWKREKQL